LKPLSINPSYIIDSQIVLMVLPTISVYYTIFLCVVMDDFVSIELKSRYFDYMKKCFLLFLSLLLSPIVLYGQDFSVTQLDSLKVLTEKTNTKSIVVCQ